MTNKNLTGFFLCNYKIFLTLSQANAQAKLDRLGDYAVSYHPPFSENFESGCNWKGSEKVEWGNPATYRKLKPLSLDKEMSERGRQLESQGEYTPPILSPLGAVMMMREYYEE